MTNNWSASSNWSVSSKQVLTIHGPGPVPLGDVINGAQEDAFVRICPNLFRVADGWDLVGAEFLGAGGRTTRETNSQVKGIILPSGARGMTIGPLHHGSSPPIGQYYSAWTLSEQKTPFHLDPFDPKFLFFPIFYDREFRFFLAFVPEVGSITVSDCLITPGMAEVYMAMG